MEDNRYSQKVAVSAREAAEEKTSALQPGRSTIQHARVFQE